jgi:hypothetical protein
MKVFSIFFNVEKYFSQHGIAASGAGQANFS